MKYYVGLNNGKREVFKSDVEPTKETHGEKYGAVVGPFKTKHGAQLLALSGGNNPHIQSVADAEKIAKEVRDATFLFSKPVEKPCK